MDKGYCLAVDIGGTNTRLAFGDFFHVYKSQEFRSFDELLKRAFAEHRVLSDVKTVSIAVAGVVDGGVCKVTNLDWTLDAKVLTGVFKKKFLIMNDLVAAAYGVGLLPKGSIVTIQEGMKREGPIAIIGPGTGLGEAFLIQVEGQKWAFASEGGHADFAPKSRVQYELFEFLSNGGHVSVEMVISGVGLKNIERFFQGDKEKAIELFFEILAQEVGNMALRFLPYGGIYFVGGLLPHYIEKLQSDAFLKRVSEKGVMSPLVRTIPLYLVTNDKTSLYGVASCA